jgi:aminoglycoside 6'-N-acetyltransferase I
MPVTTRPACPSDRDVLAAMRADLWPDASAAAHAEELDAMWGGGQAEDAIIVAESDGGVIGFAEVALRSRADGCDPGRAVGYLEGWYVAEAHRRRGVGAALVSAAEDWARAQGCVEMASDTWIDNEGSQRAHEALGFEEVDRVVTYRKAL